MPLEAPTPNGDMLSQADVLNHTLIVAPTEFIEHIQTVNTKPGEKSPAIRVHVADFADPDHPVIYRGVLWFGVISGALRRQIGSFVAGRMGQGQASPGRNAPWQLNDITAEADWMAHLNNWLDNTTDGQSFQAESITETNRAASSPTQVDGAAAQQAQTAYMNAPAQAAAAPAAPAARPAPAAAPAPRPATSVAPAPVAAPAPAAVAPAAAPVADPMAAIAGLPPEELAKVMALIAQQGQAAH